MLDQIDRALAGECPCGAPPRDGSAYCSDDCVPNYHAEHTSSDTDGTQMRWRPDMVADVDDSGLHSIGSQTWYTGRFHAQIFERRAPGSVETLGFHLRLDDGYRFVGLDVDERTMDGDLTSSWERLERELGNSRHLEPDDPWADVMVRQHRFRPFVPSAVTTWSAVDSDPLADMQAFMRQAAAMWERDAWAAQRVTRELTEALSRARESFRSARPALEAVARAAGMRAPNTPTSDHPMLAAIEARRNRNTGPDRTPRAPRQINPRRGR